MGLILPQTVKVKIHPSNYKHFKEKGYKFKKCGDIIEVNVLDLQRCSNIKIKIKCDICGKEKEIKYNRIMDCIIDEKLMSCGNKLCISKKTENTNIKKFGVINVSQSQTIKDKKKNTFINNYNNPIKLKELNDKKINTNRKHFGCDWPMQAKTFKDKINKILKEKYGEDIINPFQLESVKEKSKQTMLKNHGVEHALQNDKIRSKALNKSQQNGNGTGPCSKQQKYIQLLINGILNKIICGYLTDIYLENYNLIIEYDGTGHFLGDILAGHKNGPTKEAILREKQREDKIINKGYRMIRFIANKDRIPSDEVILNLVEGFKNSDFKVIRINFEEGTIDRDYEEKWYCNFGKLRKIAKEDLEKFKKQEENTSEN